MPPNSLDVDQIYALVDAYLCGVHGGSETSPLLFPRIGAFHPLTIDQSPAVVAMAAFTSEEDAATYSRRFHQLTSPDSAAHVQVWKSTRILVDPQGIAHVYLETSSPENYYLADLTFRRSTAWEFLKEELLLNVP